MQAINGFGILAIIAVSLLIIFLIIVIAVLLIMLLKKSNAGSNYNNYEPVKTPKKSAPAKKELQAHDLTGNETIATEGNTSLDDFWGGINSAPEESSLKGFSEEPGLGGYDEAHSGSLDETSLLSSDEGEQIFGMDVNAETSILLDDSVIEGGNRSALNAQKQAKTTIYYEDDEDSTGYLGDPAKLKMPRAFVFRVNTEERREITKPEFSLGKSVNADYTVSGNNTISRLHAVVVYKDDQYHIVDNHSSNKTYLNGEEIESDRLYPIGDKDRIRISNEDFVFHII